MNLVRLFAPCLLAGTFYLLGSWGAMPGLTRPELGRAEDLLIMDSFSDEAVAVSLIRQRAQAFRLEHLRSAGQHSERRGLYEQDHLRWLMDSGLTDDETNRLKYQAGAGSPPEFDVDQWIRNYRDAIVRFPLPDVIEMLETDLFSLFRRHGRDAEFRALYLQILRRGSVHPAIARQARFALSAVDVQETEVLLAWIRHLAWFENDARRARQLKMALVQWTERNPQCPTLSVAD
jgi:hypothetical protein